MRMKIERVPVRGEITALINRDADETYRKVPTTSQSRASGSNSQNQSRGSVWSSETAAAALPPVGKEDRPRHNSLSLYQRFFSNGRPTAIPVECSGQTHGPTRIATSPAIP